MPQRFHACQEELSRLNLLCLWLRMNKNTRRQRLTAPSAVSFSMKDKADQGLDYQDQAVVMLSRLPPKLFKSSVAAAMLRSHHMRIIYVKSI